MTETGDQVQARAFAARLIGVGKRFGATWACRGIDLDLRAGEVHALIGENGAGKSTILKLLHGVLAPDEGTIEVDGAPVRLASPRAAEATGIGMVPQELDLFPDLSVIENLFVGRARPRTRIGGFDRAAMRQAAAAAFADLDFAIDLDMPARALSSASAQMVEIARALMRDARVLLLDEPTAALSARETQTLFAIVERLRARGVAIVYVSHRLEELFRVATRVTVMRDGARVHTGPIDTLTMAGLVELMIGRPLSHLFHRERHPPGTVALDVAGLARGREFQEIGFQLRRGEIVGLAGLIGAGRSELAQAIFGIRRADAGAIRVDGRPVHIRTPAEALRHGIVYVPEERRTQGLVLERSVRWNIAFTALDRLSLRGLVARSRENAAAIRFRDLFAIRSDSIEATVGSLSGGNQQKVLLAKGLLVDPEIILLDEPTRGVDVGAKAEIYRIIDDLASRGKAVLMISSEMNELLSMADRILVMREGRLAGTFDGPDFDARAIGAAALGAAPARSVPAP